MILLLALAVFPIACSRPLPIEEVSGFAELSCETAPTSSRTARHDDSVRYRLPFEPGRPRRLAQGISGGMEAVPPPAFGGSRTVSGRSHTGRFRYAFDFEMPVGSVVLAARKGRVTCATAGTVALRHPDGTYGVYRHLSHPGVRSGESVATGAPIARSGSDGGVPHLHFQVLTSRGGASESVPIRFDDGSEAGFVPVEGSYYGSP